MTKYHHPYYGLVTVVGQFSSHTNVKTLSGIKAVQFRDLQQVDANGNPVSTDFIVVDPEVRRKPALQAAPKAIEAAADQPKKSGSKRKPLSDLPVIEVNATPIIEEIEEVDDGRTSVNDTFTAIQLGLPGVGRSRARTIVSRRPPDGYETVEQFYEMNKDLVDDEQAWKLILEKVKI